MSGGARTSDRWWVGAAALVWLGAAVWMVWISIERPSPARDVRYVDPSGPVEAGGIYCHGPAVIDGSHVWQGCAQAGDAEQQPHLVRFDLAEGSADLGSPLTDGVTYAMEGGARGPDGFVALMRDDAIVQRRSDGSSRRIGGYSRAIGIGVANGAVEVVDQPPGPGLRIQRHLGGTRWSERRVAEPPADDRDRVRVETAWLDGGEWRFVWSRRPARVDALPAEVVVLEGSEADPPQPVQTLSLDSSPLHREGEGETFLDPNWLHAPRSGLLVQSPEGILVERSEEGVWTRVPIPEGASYMVARDGVMSDEGSVRSMLRVEGPVPQVRFAAGWIRLLPGEPAALQATGGARGSALTPRFWLSNGFRILPDPRGGYWVMGSLGESYLHVDEALARDDALSFAERVARLFHEDRAKRNADFFSDGLGPLRLAAFFLVLLLPLGLVPWAAVARRRGQPAAVRRAAAGYLVCALACAYWFYRVSRYYW